MIASAYGELGIEKHVFLSEMTYADCLIKWYFYQKKKDDALKLSWEQTRYIAFCTIATQTDKIKSPHHLMPFPWEEDLYKVSKRQMNKIMKDARKNYEGHLRFLKKQENG